MKPALYALGLAAFSVTALPVHAALPPCAADKMVEEAADVVQITIETLTEAPAGEMYCQMSGPVIAVLRGEMQLGDIVSVSFPCEPLEGMVGPQSFVLHEDARVAPWAELHLTDGEIAGYGAGLALPPYGVTGDEDPTDERAAGHMVWEPDAMCV